eukprot:3762249-Pleurochrysis_carterae.AAC.1
MAHLPRETRAGVMGARGRAYRVSRSLATSSPLSLTLSLSACLPLCLCELRGGRRVNAYAQGSSIAKIRLRAIHAGLRGGSAQRFWTRREATQNARLINARARKYLIGVTEYLLATLPQDKRARHIEC